MAHIVHEILHLVFFSYQCHIDGALRYTQVDDQFLFFSRLRYKGSSSHISLKLLEGDLTFFRPLEILGLLQDIKEWNGFVRSF